MANTKVTGDLLADGTLFARHLNESHGITTSVIGEGTNLFYTDTRVGTYLGTYLPANGYDTATNIIASIVDSAPVTLDTLNELAAALGDDPNFATTVTNSLAGKLPLTGGTLTGSLVGTSATFNHNDAPTVKIQRDGGTDNNTAIEFTNASRSFYIGSNGTVFGAGGTTASIASQPLQISSTGAATFSSSVTATNGYFSGTGSGPFNSQIILNNTTSSPALITFQNTANGHAFGFNSTGTQRFTFINGSLTEIASISLTGAATFNSSVTASGYSYFGSLRLNGADNAATIWKDSGDMSIYPQSGKLYLGSQGTQNIVTVTSSGVGINNTNPSNLLTIGADSHYSPDTTNRVLNWYTFGSELWNNEISLSIGNNNASTTQPTKVGLALFNNSAAANTYSPAITFGGLSTSGDYMNGSAAIAAQLPANSDSNFRGGNLIFYTAGISTDKGLKESVRITHDGKLGVGTNLPQGKLDVVGDISYIGNTNSSVFVVRNDGSFISGGGSGTSLVVQYGGQNIATLSNTGTGQRDAILSMRDEGVVKVRIAANNSRGGDTIFNGGGYVGIQTDNPQTSLQLGRVFGLLQDINSGYIECNRAANGTYIVSQYAARIHLDSALGEIKFSNAPSGTAGTNVTLTERMRITPTGGLAIGTNSASGTYRLRAINSDAVQGDPLFAADNAVYNAILVYSVGADGYNGAATGIVTGKNTSTNRSINAGGTINASGSDYAEYITKAVDDIIAKGDIVGINNQAKLTNIFADAISFAVKSTDPSYVGGDAWFNSEKRPEKTEDQTQEEFDEIMLDFESRLEIERAKVDRIAFSGQVPCNVYNAQVGDYIIPIETEDGKIAGQPVSNPTFEQYTKAVGKVWKIMDDGRAWISVKIG